MAENLENQFGNFSIENTMEMGMGNSELLNDLMAPETASTNPDDIKEMTAEDKAPKAETSPKKAATKSIGETIEEAPEKKEETSIQDFLLGGDDEEEEEEEAPVKKTTSKQVEETNDSDDEESEPEVSQFGALANDLFKLGVFSKDEDEEDTPISTAEEFLERFQEEKKKGAIEVVNNFIGQFGEEYQQAFDAIFVKGVNPKEYFSTYDQVVNFAEMDLSDENNQKTIIKRALADQGFDAEDIESEVERLQNYGDLESVATKHHKVLVKKEASKLQQMEAKAEQELQQKAQIKNQYVSNVQGILQEKIKAKEFDGIPLNPGLARELQDFLLTDKWKTPSGELLSDFDRTILDLKRPENHAMKVKVGLLLKILEKDPTLSTIQKTGVTKQSNQLFGEVARQVTKDKTVVPGQKKSSYFSGL
jgi:hypothetical protein